MSRNLSVPTSDVVFTIDAATIDVMIQQIEPDGIRGVPGLIAMKRGLPEVPAAWQAAADAIADSDLTIAIHGNPERFKAVLALVAPMVAHLLRAIG